MEDVTFEGIDGTECEAFIRAVAKQAFLKDKDNDDVWMARFAATCFDGGALRWHDTLSEKTRGSWKLLRTALLALYPAVNQSTPRRYPRSGRITLSAPYAPSKVQSYIVKKSKDTADAFSIEYAGWYIHKQWEHSESIVEYLPSRMYNAVGVQLSAPGDKSSQIKLLNFRGKHGDGYYLGMAWLEAKVMVEAGSFSVARLVAIPASHRDSDRATLIGSKGPVRLNVWGVDSKDNLTATWVNADGSNWPLEFVWSHATDQREAELFVVADASACIALNQSLTRVCVKFQDV